MKGAGISIFGQIVLSHSTESFRSGTLLCFRKFRDLENFMPKRGVERFYVKIFCLAVPKNFVRETVGAVFQKIVGSKKVYWSEGAGGGVPRFSVDNFFASECWKFSWVNPLMFYYFRVSKNFRDKRGGRVSRFFVHCFLSHSAEKFVKEPFSVSLSSGIEKVGVKSYENLTWEGLKPRTYCLAWEPCCPNLTALFFLNEESWQFWSGKKEKWPYCRNIFSCTFYIWRKILTTFTWTEKYSITCKT